jgi:hypothetical protein
MKSTIGSNYETLTFIVDNDFSYARVNFKLAGHEVTFNGHWHPPYHKNVPLDQYQSYLVATIQTALARINPQVQKLQGHQLRISRPIYRQNDHEEVQNDWLLAEIRQGTRVGPIGMILLPYDTEPRVLISSAIKEHKTSASWARPYSTKNLFTLKELADILWDNPELLIW